MDPTIIADLPDKVKEYDVVSADKSSTIDPDADVHITVVPSSNTDQVPTIIIDSLPNDNDLTVTPAFPNFPTDEEVVITPDAVVLLEPPNSVSEQGNNTIQVPTNISPPSQQTSQILDELKYLLKATNSLARPEASIQASQEADSAIKQRTRTIHLDEDALNDSERLLIDALTPNEAKSLDAVERRSIASRSQYNLDRSRAASMHSMRAGSMHSTRTGSQSQPATILVAQPEHRTIFDHLSGLFWAFFAAYAFTIILFLTKMFGIDLIFGFFLQMIVQTIAFGVYAFYKGYNLLGPNEYRIAMIGRALLIGIGVLTSFLAYYYITLPDLSAIRQTQVILTTILSIFFLHERPTISRIIACILTIIGIVILIRPTNIGASSSTVFNQTNNKNYWIPYSSPWNHLIGIGFVLCTVITYSIASIMNKIYFSTQHLYNTVLCFWSALSALIISIILVFLAHFLVKDSRVFPEDRRLFVAIALAVASIFVFIANQKAIKRERSSVVTLIYATDIILALILQNLFTNIKSDIVVIIGCILILAAVLIICIEVLLMEQRKKALAIKVAEVVNRSAQNNNSEKP